jgi:hypothetical protein
MPVVVELRAVGLKRYHPHLKDLQVVPGTPGFFVTGVKVTRVHINQRLFVNFQKLTQMKQKGSPVALSGVCGSGSESFTTCGCTLTEEFLSRRRSYVPGKWYKSSSHGHVYCPNCAGYICKSDDHKWLGIEPPPAA